MDAVLTRDCSEQLLSLAKRGVDPLGYARRGSLEDMDCEVEQINHMDELAADALTGRDQALVRRLATRHRGRRLDDVTAALLVHMGVSPTAACALWEILADAAWTLEIMDLDDADEAITVRAGAFWSIAIGGGVTWRSYGDMRLPALPHTVAAGASGPLRHLLSHPVLDRHPLLVAGIAPRPDSVLPRPGSAYCEATVTGMIDAGDPLTLLRTHPLPSGDDHA